MEPEQRPSIHSTATTPPSSTTGDVKARVERLRLRAHRASRAHYLTARRLRRRHNILGIPVVVLTTLVGTASFASLSEARLTSLVAAAGVLSIGAAVLSAMQTFFSYAATSEAHRVAGAKYAAIKRRLDLLDLSIPIEHPTQIMISLESVVADIGELEINVPPVPDLLYDQARAEQGSDEEGV